MSTELILALDIGTSSVRTALFDLTGRRLVETTFQQTYLLDYTKDGGAELPPARLKRAAFGCLARTLKTCPPKRTVIAAGTTSFWHSFLGVDARNQPRTPIYTWADSRCRTDAAALRAEFSERRVHARTGCMLRSSFWPAKLAWLRRTRPDLKVARWVSPGEWLQGELLGRAHCGFSMASGTGLFNPSRLKWDAALLDRFNLAEGMLNPLSDEPLTGCPAFSALKKIPWFPATGDGAASNLGSGATQPGLAALNAGTSAALRVMKSGRRADAPFGLFCYRVDAKRFLAGGAVSNVGNLRGWCLRELRLDEQTLEAELAKRPAPEHGLTVLPFWTAERAPDWDEETPGSIIGITHDTTALDLLQAITEASYQRLARIAALLLATEKIPPRFIVSGGILSSQSSLQRLADVLNQPLYINDEPEATLRGAAVFVIEKLGLEPAPIALRRPIKPRARFAEIYRSSSVEREA